MAGGIYPANAPNHDLRSRNDAAAALLMSAAAAQPADQSFLPRLNAAAAERPVSAGIMLAPSAALAAAKAADIAAASPLRIVPSVTNAAPLGPDSSAAAAPPSPVFVAAGVLPDPIAVHTAPDIGAPADTSAATPAGAGSYSGSHSGSYGSSNGVVLPAGRATAVSAVAASPIAMAAGDAQTAGASAAGGAYVMTQQSTFAGHAIPFSGGASGYYFSLPSSLYQQYGVGFSTSAGGVSLSGTAFVAAGIKGGVSIGLGNITPNFPVTINPHAPTDGALDGTVFTVDPTLVSTDDASFSLALVNASSSLDIAFGAFAGAAISTPSLKIGFTIPAVTLFGIGTPSEFVGFTIPSETLSLGPFPIGQPNFLLQLPPSITISKDGVSLQVAEIQPTTVSSGTVSAWGSLPTLTASGQTKPFVVGTLDLLTALGLIFEPPQSDPLRGSVDIEGLEVQYTLLSVPLSLSLNLGEGVTLTPTGIDVTVTDPLNGEIRSGPLGTPLSFDAPASGTGTIPLQASYTLDLAVASAIGLYGTLAIALDGPIVGSTFLGIGPSIGPIFTHTFYSKGGELAQLNSWHFNTSITSTATIDVPFAGVTSTQTVAAPSGAVTLAAAGTKLIVAGSGAITGATYGVSAAHPAIINNYGVIVAGSYGIYAAGGGSIRNLAGARILGAGTTASGVGIDAPQPLLSAQIYNVGTISGFTNGIYAAAGTVTNDAGGLISASGGIVIGTGNARVINAGSIAGGNGIGLPKGGSVYDPSTGIITAHTQGVRADGLLTLLNKGTITARIEAVYADAGASVTNAAGGVMTGSLNAGVALSGGPVTLANAGTISGFNTAASLGGSSNTLMLAPGAVFHGSVVATASVSNVIELLSGSSTGTLAGLGAAYAGFNAITFDPGAAWTVEGAATAFSGVTLAGLTPLDTLDLAGLPYSPGETALVNTASNVLSVYGATRGSIVTTLQLSGTVSDPQFAVSSDGAGGTDLTEVKSSHSIVGNNPGVRLGTASSYGSVVNVVYTGAAGSPTGATAGIAGQDLPATIANYGMLAGSSYGISLQQGGTVTNGSAGGLYESGATIYGYKDAIDFGSGAGRLNNLFGTIASEKGYAILAGDGSRLTNGPHGVITGPYGIDLSGTNVQLVNQGLIDVSKAGVRLPHGGTIANYGNILGTAATDQGVYVRGGSGSLVNHGAILFPATAIAGVQMRDGGNIYNDGGTIVGGPFAAFLHNGSKVDNFGGTIAGVTVDTNGSILNQGGTILSADAFGINLAGKYGTFGTVTVTNAIRGIVQGIYSSDNTTISNAATSTIDGYGIVVADRTAYVSGLWLTNAGLIKATEEVGTIATALSVAAAASITNQSGGTISAAITPFPSYGIMGSAKPLMIVNSGLISGATNGVAFGAAPGTVVNAGTISGGAAAVAFATTGGDMLVIEPGSTLNGGVANFAAGDTIDFAGLSETFKSFTGSMLALAGDANITLALTGSFTAGQVRVGPDHAGGSQVTIACFASGTRVLTARGEVEVGSLRAGEVLPAVHARRLARVVWLGHRQIDCLRHPRPAEVWPVRVAAGAFGNGCPHRDLWLSPDHAVLVRAGAEDVLIPIRRLLNGRTIEQVPTTSITYWHIELSHHDAILAEGLRCETYLDTGNRSAFANAGNKLDLHPGFASRAREARTCAPLVTTGDRVEAIRRRLLVMGSPVRAAAARMRTDTAEATSTPA